MSQHNETAGRRATPSAVDSVTKSIFEAATWWKHYGNSSLHDSKVAGRSYDGLMCIYGAPPSMLNYSPANAARCIVNAVAYRERIIRRHPSDGVVDGKLLRCYLDETTNTQTAKNCTNGFFDDWDLPPCGLWVGFLYDEVEHASTANEYLLSLVPSELVKEVGLAIQSSAEENIVWLEDVDCPWSEAVRNGLQRHQKRQ